MNNISKPKFHPGSIVVHCSASDWGDVKLFRKWHQARGWSDIGYHAVILNGKRTSVSKYSSRLDGKIETGRPETIKGAHCKANNMNAHSLGVCLVGHPGKSEGYPSERQIRALVHYLVVKCIKYRIPVNMISQHSDHEPLKPFCASIDLDDIRRRVDIVMRST